MAKVVRGVMEFIRIGGIGNGSGDLWVKASSPVIDDVGVKFYWSIEDYNGHYWEEIPKYLFDALLQYEGEQFNSGD